MALRPKVTPLAGQEIAGSGGFTHSALINADDLTVAVNSTKQTLKLGPIPKFAIVRKAKIIINKPFRNRADSALNSVTLSLGDALNSDTQFVGALEAGYYNNVVFNDGVTNTDTSLVSATATFVAGDVGQPVTGAGIPAGTTIASRTNGTTVVLSQATTATATGVSITLPSRTATPVTTPQKISTATFSTPYAAADQVNLVATPLSGKKLSDIDEGEAMVLLELQDNSVLAASRGQFAVAKA